MAKKKAKSGNSKTAKKRSTNVFKVTKPNHSKLIGKTVMTSLRKNIEHHKKVDATNASYDAVKELVLKNEPKKDGNDKSKNILKQHQDFIKPQVEDTTDMFQNL
ncbi:unnamed protein product [Clavelina lepadiformis]|uniref:Uncharacterized protein n=1 Tax=Clavelina lepadiformis TaxID=159417 RepID=A0ABP0GBM1_CLALP